VIAGIGQGYWKATTLQLARATAAIADDGRLRRLHLVVSERAGFEAPWQPLPQPAPKRVAAHANVVPVQEGMVGTITHGTAYSMGVGATYQIAGKTGTAQRVSRRGNVSTDPKHLPMHLRHQAWFVGYAPAEAPTIVVAVSIEGGGYGASTAAPVARRMLDAWLAPKAPDTPAPGIAPAGTAPVRPRATPRPHRQPPRPAPEPTLPPLEAPPPDEEEDT
jgi:penicillin-binding protein 2